MNWRSMFLRVVLQSFLFLSVLTVTLYMKEHKYTMEGGPSDSKWTMGGGPSDSKQIMGGSPSDSKQTMGGGPSDSKRTMGSGASDSKQKMGGGPSDSKQTMRGGPSDSKQTMGGGPSDSKQTMGGGPSDSKRTMGGGPRVSKWTMGGGPSDSKWTMGGGPSDSKQTMRGGPSDSKQTMGGGPSDSKQTMGGGPSDSKRTMGGGPRVSKWTMGGGPSDSKWTMGGGPSDSKQTMRGGPSDSKQTMGGGPSDSKQTMGGGPSDSKRTMGGGPRVSKWTMGGGPSDSKWTMGGGPSDSKRTMGGGPRVSKWTMGGGPSDSKWTMGGDSMGGDASDAKRAQPRFVYAIQTESCLPVHLKKALGNPDECNCDVLVLSYKQSCTAVFPHHIKYINGSSLSWPEGRNLLWQVAKSWHIQYLYYIFMDDDVVLTTNKSGNPWRQFERFLFNIEPAVAAVDVDTHQFLPHRKYALWHNKCVVDHKRNYVTMARFDEAFNAFHYQTLDYLLPYSTNHIMESWWLSSVHFGIKCEVTFRGQMVVHTQIKGINRSHRRYPRGHVHMKNLLIILSEVVKELPHKFRNSSVLLGWKRDGLNHEKFSSTYCLPPPPPHMPIKPFALL